MTGQSRRSSALVAVVSSVAGLVVTVVGQRPAAAAAPDTRLSGTASTMYQTNAQVAALAYSNGVLYAGGDFTAVRPNGVAVGGTGTVSRTYLAAFNSSTGALISSFNVTLNGKVKALDVSPDGGTLYLGGNFTTVNGTTRNRAAAVSTSTGALTAFNPSVNNTVYAIESTSSRVYLGGNFTTIKSVSQPHLGEVDASTGARVTTFTATADGMVDAINLATAQNRLLVGGAYNTIAGVTQHGMAALDPTTGANQPWAATSAAPGSAAPFDPNNPNASCNATITSIQVSNGVAYMGEAGDGPGCEDGTYAANISDGSLVWKNVCEGGTQTVAVVNNVLYKGSHNHDCSVAQGGAFGGFTGDGHSANTVLRHLLAQNLSDGSFEHWDPDTNGGSPGFIGPVSMATDGTQLFVAGDFTTVNGTSQQGLTRFRPKGTDTAPKALRAAPSVFASAARTMTVQINGDTDIDNGVLTYRIYRNGGTTPVYTTTVESWDWAQPTIRFNDTNLTAGTAYRYSYRVSDASSTTASSPTSSNVTASATNPTSYPTAVLSASPTAYLKLDDAGGSTAADSSGNGNGAQYVGGTGSTSGAYSGGSAVTLDGSSGYVTSDQAVTPTSTSYTESAWFKTTTVTGGDILGFADTQTGGGSNTNYTVRMDNDGQVVGWVAGTSQEPTPPGQLGPPATMVTVRSPRSYNDGRWHNVVVTYDGTTQILYVDGVPVDSALTAASTPFAGYWRAGYVNLDQSNDVFGFGRLAYEGYTSPMSYYFNAAIDDVAVYGTALSASTVAAQWTSNATAG